MMWIGKTMLAAALAAAPAIAGAPTMPGWLSGCWSQERDPSWSEECWSGPRGDIMLGEGRTGRSNTLNFWEEMQIERAPDGKLTFYAQPRGGPRVAFPMVSVSERTIEFANPQHDFPQRIRYWREGMDLNVETSLADGSKALRWHYTRLMR